MKRVTIALDDQMYLTLLDYAAQKSKRELRRYSMGEAIRELVSSQLSGSPSPRDARLRRAQ